MLKARAIALYLPQFHPIPENNLWWGEGFTEWTNTARAKPLFRSHYQPHVPADLGFYDLRLHESRVQQAELAAAYGIEGFCYYHYWFAGRRILNRPFDEVVAASTPTLPFCLCWANETWSGVWFGAADHILIEQTYPGESDHRAHFATLLPAFRDPRYIRVDGKPLFVIHRALQLPDPPSTLRLWREMAVAAGLPGLHLVGSSTDQAADLTAFGYDATMRAPGFAQRPWVSWQTPLAALRRRLQHWRGLPNIYRFADFADRHMPRREACPAYPCVVHAWDNTPRSGRRGVVFQDSDPAHYRRLLSAAVAAVADKPAEQRLVFLKSWNEWAEGNHLEPDLRHGRAYLEVVRSVLGGSETTPATAG